MPGPRYSPQLLRAVMAAVAATAVGMMLITTGAAQNFTPVIPRTWDDTAVEGFHLPLAPRDRSPQFMSAAEYYQLKERPIYKSYPVYVPEREPVGYMDWLKQQEPEIAFDPLKLRTEEDWSRAGELVFDAPTDLTVPPPEVRAQIEPLMRASLQEVAKLVRPTRDGVLPYVRYFIVEKGIVQIGGGCQICHTRVMPDGTVAKGAQGDFPVDQFIARQAEVAVSQPGAGPLDIRTMREQDWILSGVPWVSPRAEFDKISDAEWIWQKAAVPPGVHQRQGTTATHPPHTPSLIGIRDHRYLDATGLIRHRSIGDLMRYAALNYGLDIVAHFGDFQPSPTMLGAQDGTRYSDEQLYALAKYLYSLEPPANPNPVTPETRRGALVFEQQRCAGCHTPPLYTNNMLTPAPGFVVPGDLRTTDTIMNVSVGTDPSLTTKSRRGTGFYKVPSLRGVWYRNAFGHNG